MLSIGASQATGMRVGELFSEWVEERGGGSGHCLLI